MSTATVRFCNHSQANCSLLAYTVRPKHVFLLFRGLWRFFFPTSFLESFFHQFQRHFWAVFASDNPPFLKHLLVQFVGLFLIVFWFQKGTPKTAQKRPVRRDHPKGNKRQCAKVSLSATQFAHNEAEMPSDGVVRSKTRPRWPQSGLKIVWCC